MAEDKKKKEKADEGKVEPEENKAEQPKPEGKKEKKKKEKKSQKERPRSKKKHTKVQIWKLYKTEGGTIKRKNDPCPRCGAGTFLANYKNRTYCGKCGYSQIKEQGKK